VAPAGDYRAPVLSPDGRFVAIRRREDGGGNADVWLLDLSRGTRTRFTFDPGNDGNALWSPDGSQVVWSSDRGGAYGLWAKSAGGMGEDRLVTKVAGDGGPTSWSSDGRYVLYQVLSSDSGFDIWLLPMTGSDHTPKPLVRTPFQEGRAQFSPDGHWIAYQSDESGRPEIYVSSFEGPPGKWQVSTAGGTDPAWSADGKELFYLESDRMMTVPVQLGATFTPGTPHPLFRVVVESGVRRNVFVPSKDGQRFLFLLPVGETSTPMTVTVNWRETAQH
jgi:Tol biopolymer transport system component